MSAEPVSAAAAVRAPGPASGAPPGLAAVLAGAALVGMVLIPLIEIATRPWRGQGVANAPVLVQHLGLAMAMFGAIAGERSGHLTTLGSSLAGIGDARWQRAVQRFADASAAVVCGLLAWASAKLVDSEMAAGQALAYGIPLWSVQAVMPLGFAWLGLKLGLKLGLERHLRGSGAGSRTGPGAVARGGAAAALVALGLALGWAGSSQAAAPPAWGLALGVAWTVALLLAGGPIFAVLGALALALFWSDGLPLASVALSHYQITVNPSLPALPLFTLAGLIFARTAAAQRLGALFLALFGSGVRGTVLAAAVLCSTFTAFTGGSGVTILALGGLLLPLLRNAGYPQQRGIGLVTSASALGVLLAPSVPLIMYAVIARVPMGQMFLAGLVPAFVMVACLLLIGGFLKREPAPSAAAATELRPNLRLALTAAWAAKWEIAAPAVAIGALASGLATPTEAAALTAAYAVLTQAVAHRELGWQRLGACLGECVQVIGGVMLILGMALALTNFMVDAGIPDAAVAWAQGVIPNRYVFLLVLCLFLFAAAALMEIYAAIVVLVPLLLPVALAYGIDPLHFGIIFLAAMEVGFLCPPAGMNIYFAAAMFDKPVSYVARSVAPAMAAIFVGTLLIALLPPLATALPAWLGGR